MTDYKTEILNNICYTDLVYGRINKKLNIQLSRTEIEKMMLEIITETPKDHFQKTGKNIYITHLERNIKITVNSYTNRIITVDKLKKREGMFY